MPTVASIPSAQHRLRHPSNSPAAQQRPGEGLLSARKHPGQVTRGTCIPQLLASPPGSGLFSRTLLLCRWCYTPAGGTGGGQTWDPGHAGDRSDPQAMCGVRQAAGQGAGQAAGCSR